MQKHNAHYTTFKQLHETNELLILPNAWNAKSAQVLASSGFKAIGTSSAAVAESLGYADGEKMSFAEYYSIIKNIAASINIPLTVDMKMGYGNSAAEIIANIQSLHQLQVAGINLEDSFIDDGKKQLKNAQEFSGKLKAIHDSLVSENIDMFINVRCDTYLLNVANKQNETLQRIKLYEGSGADAIFLPCISDVRDMKQAASATSLPLSAMCIPGLPAFDAIKTAGFKRVSMGPFLFMKLYDELKHLSAQVLEQQNFSSLF